MKSLVGFRVGLMFYVRPSVRASALPSARRNMRPDRLHSPIAELRISLSESFCIPLGYRSLCLSSRLLQFPNQPVDSVINLSLGHAFWTDDDTIFILAVRL